ncbi:MAG: amino acid adenylation domain-containing protein [Scytonematopsis contorta HA4267-MV1]|nr:amino acid adenylation domain-containing protein [Scytonematopsis contorta HA4267-MV1]
MKNQNIMKFLSQLRKLNIQVSSEGEKLRFQAPEGVLTPALYQQIAERKAEILAFLQQVRQEAHTNPPPISVIPRDGNLPLSFAQERLWFLDQLDGLKTPYIEQGALQISGKLNILALQQAFTEIVRRHEVFRTRFQSVNGIPMQVIVPDATLEMAVEDWQHLPKTQQEQQVKQYAQQQTQIPFDLSGGNLLRVSLLHLALRESVLLVTMHHIVADVWSIGIFVQELSALYQAYSQGKPSPLPELSIQYADFAFWQRQWLTSEIQHKQLQYWRQQLADAPTLLQLPTDRPRPPVQKYQGSTQIFTVGKHLTEQLQKLSQNAESTMFMTMLAAFAVLLFRYSGQEDILIGSPIANRNRSEIESLIGFFPNTIALRTHLEGNPSFEQLLGQVRKMTLLAYACQDVPFERVVETLQPERSLSYSPLFQVMFILQNAPMKSLELPGVTLTPLQEIHPGTAKFDLALSMEETETGLIGTWEYSTDLFEDQTIARMAGHFQTLLEAIVANPKDRIENLPLLSATERQQLLAVGNNNNIPPVQDKCVNQLFEEQVERVPEAVAVMHLNQQLTYRQLNERANQLAHYLQHLGMEPEALVSLSAERSIEMIVGLLGILKAGGAYVPVNPSEPTENLVNIPENLLSVSLTQQKYLCNWSENKTKVVALDSEWEAIAQHSTENLNSAITSENLAYVLALETQSISVEHQAVVRRLNWLQSKVAISQGEAVLHQTSLGQESLLREILLPLVVGGCVVIAPIEGFDSAASWQQLIAQKKISIVNFLPSQLTAFARCLNATTGGQLTNLRWLLCSGESLYQSEVEVCSRYLDAQLLYMYSLPETAGEVSCWQSQSGERTEVLPVGFPTYFSVYVLDPHGEPVPPGVVGEVYVGDSYLTGSDLHQTQKSPVSFVEHPQLGCLLKTGELGCRRLDGCLELRGFRQRCAWIKGHRVELQAIERALLAITGVEDCYVMVRQRELVAYVVASKSFLLESLHSQLQSQLPSYMLPSTYVPVFSLPLTVKGRVDESALARLEVIDSELVSGWEQLLRSQSEIEQVAVVVQPKVKTISRVHIDDLVPLQIGVRRQNSPSVETFKLIDKDKNNFPLEVNQLAISEGEPLREPELTLGEILQRAAQKNSTIDIIYIQTDGTEFTQSYADLLEDAQRIFAGLKKLGLKPQDKVIFQLDQNQDFIPAFWGCVLGGFVPVPISVAPTYEQVNSTVNKLQNTWQMLRRPLVLTNARLAPAIRSFSELLNLENFQVKTVDDLRACTPDQNRYISQPDDLAVLLLTSGSTGMPKAVMQSHRSLLSRSAATAVMNNFTSNDVSLNWFPLDHVGGLVMFHLRDVYLRCQQIHAPTEMVLQAPMRWLDWISHYQATITWAPNFAYGLLNAQVQEFSQGNWDLSSMRFLLNGGEAIVAKHARKFLELLAPYGLRATAMHPAWGMSETCSGVTYSHNFTLDSTTDDDSFVSVGSPIPGFSIRIANIQNQLVKEGIIGHIQVKGASVTSGYYENTEINQEAFTDDGWFNTGDLGFLHEGCLTITGREKDEIIINGLNYYSHELEAVVEKVEGVEVSYTAAFAVRSTNGGTDKLIIFFSAAFSDEANVVKLIQGIRSKLVENSGINPHLIIPLDKQAIPKTAIGKIQRLRLKQRLEAGEFNEIIKRLDLVTSNANTLPDWFYQKIWRHKEGLPLAPVVQTGMTLIFLDQLGLGTFLCDKLNQLSQHSVIVEVGSKFAKISSASVPYYRINPNKPRDYQRLLESLAANDFRIAQILHLWTYDEYGGEVSSLETLEQAQEQGIYSLLFLVQALNKVQGSEHLVRLQVISSYGQLTSPTDKIAAEKSTLIGFLKTISLELPWLRCRHIDLEVKPVEVNAEHILQELHTPTGEEEIAYRNGRRLVSSLAPVDILRQETQDIPLKQGGIYLVTGGLGGIGTYLSQFLIEEYCAKLIIVGRTPLPNKTEWSNHFHQKTRVAKRIKNYQAIEATGGEFIYEAVDICDLAGLQKIVAQAESKWNQPLSGIIHLAGEGNLEYHWKVIDKHWVAVETQQNFNSMLRPKVYGTWTLYQLIKDKPQAVVISFSSINGVFGGATFSAYSAANSFLSCYSLYRRYHSHPQTYCFNWAMWDDTGMSEGNPAYARDAARSAGYYVISKEQGLSSLLAGLYRNQAQIIVGLDGSNRNIRRYTDTGADGVVQLTAYFTSKVKELPAPELEGLEVSDCFGTLSHCLCVQLAEMPVTETGEIAREKLLGIEAGIGVFEQTKPRNQLERQLVEIFQQVLAVPQVGIHHNFFALGGNSLLAVQVVSRIQRTLSQYISLQVLFEAPTVAQLGQTLSLRNQGNLLAGQESDCSLETLVPAPEQRYEPFPLTEIQQAYWLGRNQAFDLGNIASHVYLELDCQNLNLERLNQAWQKLVDHHDMLRAVVLPNGQQQVKQQVPAYQIQVFDKRGSSPSAVTKHLNAIREQMSHEILPSEHWPLFKLCATHLESKNYRLHLSFDALIADGWSLMLLGQQWLQLYRNPESLLPSLELSFRDYVQAQIALSVTPQYQRSQQYWFGRLSSLPPAPELPKAKQAAALSQPQFQRRSAGLDAVDWQRLKDRASQANLTNSGVLLAAFADILTRWSKSPKFTINLTLFNRLPLHPQVNQVIGDFTSLTLLSVDNSEAASFTSRAQRLQGQLWKDLDHRYVSGVAVQRELRRQYGSYQAMGVVFTSTLGVSSLTEQQLWVNQLGQMVYSISQTPQVWLDHQVLEEGGNLVFHWDTVEELFPEGLVDDMFNSYTNYLQHLAKEESAWLETHPQLLPKSQLCQRIQVNQTDAPVSQQTLHGLFLSQVERRPQALAVIAPEGCLTYQELYQRSRYIGHRLRQLGVSSNSLVAVVMFKGWEQVVAVLAILMSGAAYVPVDPELPQQRREYLLTQGSVKLVLTQERLVRQLSMPEGIECLSVDTLEWENSDSSSFVPVHHPLDLAYVIYTSGSTGLPKGVMIHHQAVVNTILDINQRFCVTPDDRLLAVSAFNFDLSVYDIFGLLAAGGTIVIPAASSAKDPACWHELIVTHQVTLWNSVPALMQMLVEYLSGQPNQSPGSLRLALLSGDCLPQYLPELCKALWPQVQVVSLGGATEASIWSICYPIDPVHPTQRSIPYGKPLLNQTFSVLNHLMQPTPVWVPGQLYIGGTGLASGYFQDRQKTFESFITHPVTHERLYKTGDLGRYLPDGNIEFLGRQDLQVKINGYRIELGEIEATLIEHSTVKEAVVSIQGQSPQHQRLVAYIVPSQSLADNTKLPEAYQPSQTQDVVLDPIERIEFKLKQPGLRPPSPTQSIISLPIPEFDRARQQAYLQRQSYRQFLQQPISLPEFSQFLSCLFQMKLEDFPLPKYLYPSAGNLYPVQTYLLIKPQTVSGLEGGIYYYSPCEHRLVLLNPLSDVDGSIYGGNQPVFEQSAFALFLIGKLSAISPMYGELAEKFCLLEAGHIGQLLMSSASNYQIGLCPIGYLHFDQLRNLFELESNQPLLYSFVGGKIDPVQSKQLFASQSNGSSGSIFVELRKFLQQKLPEYMIPAEYVLLNTLPLNANGKVDRKALPVPDTTQSLQAQQQLQENFVPPRDLVELRLTQIWSDILNISPVGVRDNFFDLGGNSLFAIRLMTQIEQHFGKNLPLATLFQGQTIEQLAAILREQSDSNFWSSLVSIQTLGHKQPFFCVAGGGGNVLYFYHLARHLGLDQPFYALQTVGLDGESEPYTRVEDMAAHYVEAIKSVQPQGPYFLGGHSFGALVAFETAQQLQKQGDEVALLAILDMHAPDMHKPESSAVEIDVDWDGAKMLVSIAGIFERMFGKNIGVSYEALQPLAPEEQLNYVNERFKMVNIFPPGTGVKTIRGLLQVGKANQQCHYVPQEIYPTQITLFRANEEAPIEIAASEEIYQLLYDSRKIDPVWGWGQFSAGEVELHIVPGDHLTMIAEPHICVLAEKLRACLENAQAENPIN